ncbi:MAG: SURF1 family protein [Nitrosomonadaceae bacterium]|nr:SURF1 family protein [Nitrosomonadaceae bacterium]
MVVMLLLGNWQLSRAQEKEARQEQLERLSQQPAVTMPIAPVRLEDFKFHQVEASGTYVPAHTIYIDNKTYKGIAGYHIITPLRLGTSSMHVLVNRGWVAAGDDRSKLPQVPTSTDQVIVTGVAISPTQRTLELSTETVLGQVWENLHLERYREATGLALQPVVILQQGDLKDGLVRQWDRPDSGAARNLGYAVQWFAMALTIMIIYLVLSVKRERPQDEQT